jgi:hypothetical protein
VWKGGKEGGNERRKILILQGKLLKWAEPSKLHDQQLLVALTVGLAFGWSGGSTLLGFDGFLLIFVGGIVYLEEEEEEESCREVGG